MERVAPLVSIVIPAYREKYLQYMIDDIFEMSSGTNEVIAVLDGYWPDPPLQERENLIICHVSQRKGMRSAINKGAALARGEYLMKADAHCIFPQKFDIEMVSACHEEFCVVPVRCRWHPEKREVDDVLIHSLAKAYEFQYISADPENPLKGKDWPEYAERVKGQDYPDLMTFQGSCWMMTRKKFQEIGGLDEDHYGMMGREAQEVSLKIWLSGGRCILNRKTWYGHWSKPKEDVIPGMKEEKAKSVAYAKDLWFGDKWPLATRKLSWLIDHFHPVPTWENWQKPVEIGPEHPIQVPAQKPIKIKYKTEPKKITLPPTSPVHQVPQDSPWDRVLAERIDLSPDKKYPPEPDEVLSQDGLKIKKMVGMSREGLYKLFAEKGFMTGAEIGVWRGLNALIMMQTIPDLYLLLVDPYANYLYGRRIRGQESVDRAYNRAHQRFDKNPNAKFLHMFSEEASLKVSDGSLDFVYIDGNHNYDYVMVDVCLWRRKVRSGGIVSGHDYYYSPKHAVGVRKALEDYVRFHQLELFVTDKMAEANKERAMPSWYFINP